MLKSSTSKATSSLLGSRRGPIAGMDRDRVMERRDESGRISPSGGDKNLKNAATKIVHKNFYNKFSDDFDEDDV
jgi:hypothetical protein